jgi:hypothetical protein
MIRCRNQGLWICQGPLLRSDSGMMPKLVEVWVVLQTMDWGLVYTSVQCASITQTDQE